MALKSRLSSRHGIMLREHYTITKEQRCGKGKADDQGRQLVRMTPIRHATRPVSMISQTTRPKLSQLSSSDNRRNISRDGAELTHNEVVTPSFSHFQHAMSRRARPHRALTRVPHATACAALFPLTARLSRQSHFRLRYATLQVIVAACLKIGQANRSLLRIEYSLLTEDSSRSALRRSKREGYTTFSKFSHSAFECCPNILVTP